MHYAANFAHSPLPRPRCSRPKRPSFTGHRDQFSTGYMMGDGNMRGAAPECGGLEWVYHNGHCYLFDSVHTPYLAAEEKYNEVKGGYLADVLNGDENNFIMCVFNVINPKDGTDYWLGGLDADRDKGLQWMSDMAPEVLQHACCNNLLQVWPVPLLKCLLEVLPGHLLLQVPKVHPPDRLLIQVVKVHHLLHILQDIRRRLEQDLGQSCIVPVHRLEELLGLIFDIIEVSCLLHHCIQGLLESIKSLHQQRLKLRK